jgi:hypothetical protein
MTSRSAPWSARAGENLIANADIWCHHSLPCCLDSVASKASRDPQVSSLSRPRSHLGPSTTIIRPREQSAVGGAPAIPRVAGEQNIEGADLH